MTRKEIPTPTADELARRLAGIDTATREEELERRRRGLTQEPPPKRIKRGGPIPIGDVIPPRTPVHLPNLRELRTRSAGQERQLELKERDLEYYLAEWEKNNRGYELTHLSQDATIRPEREAHDLPVGFVDFLIDEATKSDLREDDRQLLFSILHNLDKIIIYNTASTIQIGLRDNEKGLIRLYFEAKPPFVLRKAE